jgi:molybdenum cofactor cytidylyltransferase
MGRCKLALPLGNRRVIEHVVLALREGGVERVLVAIGPHGSELELLAFAAGADVAVLPSATADMRATVEHGLHWFDEHHQLGSKDAWLLAPADHPMIEPQIVRDLCNSFAREPEKSIVVPTYNDKRGHPVLIGWSHVAGIRALPPGEGIEAYLRRHVAETRELPVTNEGILCDLDTPGDYERLRGLIPS